MRASVFVLEWLEVGTIVEVTEIGICCLPVCLFLEHPLIFICPNACLVLALVDSFLRLRTEVFELLGTEIHLLYFPL